MPASARRCQQVVRHEPKIRKNAPSQRLEQSPEQGARQGEPTSGWQLAPQAKQAAEPERLQPRGAAGPMTASARSGSITREQLKRYNLSHQHHQHHHYDYCNGSEVAAITAAAAAAVAWSPGTVPAGQQAGSAFNNHNYDQNILLFATEHSQAKSNNVGELESRQAEAGQHQSGHQGQISKQQDNQEQHIYHQRQQRRPLSTAAMPTGRFVSQYPSWRQSQSSTTGHYQNYSFHVPVQQAARRGETLSEKQRLRAASSQRASSLSRSTRSRTVEHLQHLTRERNFLLPYDDDNYNRAYEEFLGADPIETPLRRQLVLSAGNLIDVQRTQSHDGSDNPFKPGTDLSWEADLMVRLMQRGYPVSELPGLVQSAKQVARRQSSVDLSSLNREVWAGGLSRAKSLGRCTGSASRDSIDRLIASIEQLVAEPREPRQTERLPDEKRPKTKQSPEVQKPHPTRATAATSSNRPNKNRERKTHTEHRVKTKDIDCCVLS